MKRRLMQIVTLVSLCFSACQSFSQPIELEKMSSHNMPHQWLFSFYLSAPTQYRTFRLDNPDRFVLDLKDVHTKQHLRYKPLIGTPVKDLRFSSHKDNIFRVVFDLDMGVSAAVREVHVQKSGERKLQVVFARKTHHLAGFDWPIRANHPTIEPSLLRQVAHEEDSTKKKSTSIVTS